MARVVLVVEEAEKELWVKQAHQEQVTLSEWLRRAARQRAGESTPPQIVEASYLSDTTTTVSVSKDQPTGIETIPSRIREARQILDRPFSGPDLKPSQTKR